MIMAVIALLVFKEKALGPALYIKPNGNTPAYYKVLNRVDIVKRYKSS
jgi:hypothetical protein